MFCSLEDLQNESDVEQKLLWPLLTSPSPVGLGYSPVDVRTKCDIRQLKIDKGKSEKLYHPDYVLLIAGLPIFIVEAKNPAEDANLALREARLYAHELNASFPHGLNPCRRIVSSNGHVLLSAPVDHNEADIRVDFKDIDPTSVAFEAFRAVLSRGSAQKEADRIRDALTTRPLFRAINFVGGSSVRDEDIGYNDFGSGLAIDFRHVFNPESRKERRHIVQNAYVGSQRRERYVDEIDRIIATAVHLAIPGAADIEDTSEPAEIFKALRAGRALENEIMLLIGPRGAGKSTFVDYCREVKLPKDLLDSTVWVHLNFNDAPSERSLLERWILEELISGLRNAYPEIDFDEQVEKVFAVEVNQVKKAMSRINPTSEAYALRLTDRVLELQADALSHAKAMARFCSGERARLLVVVFDNCDKRERDEQLQMFQAARWLQQQVRCVVILPVRDVTYDLYRDQPPLDTMIKDLVFRIDPPSFTEILRRRLDLVLHELAMRTKEKLLTFTLDNGWKVQYPATERGYYLASIFRSLYTYDRLVRSLILGLAGKDIRRAMEIFLEFCRSGHIGPKEYWKIKTQRGEYSLPFHVVTRVLLRRDKRFYNGDASFVKNLFQCVPTDPRPDIFVRADVLEWLKQAFYEPGPTGIKGFHPSGQVVSELMPLGHDADRTREEIRYLAQHGCIVTEHQRNTVESDADLVRLAPAGFAHLNLVNDLTYLSACAEETWVENEALARRVAKRCAQFGPKTHFSRAMQAANGGEFVEYLVERADRDGVRPTKYLQGGFSGVAIDGVAIAERARRQVEEERASGGWEDFEEQFPNGIEVGGVVDGIQEYGLFVKLDGGPVGLLYMKRPPEGRAPESFKKGDRLVVRILDSEPNAQKVRLEFVADAPIR
ncbi:MAG: type I restriction endonuclease [Planctomycetaceae bacterium]